MIAVQNFIDGKLVDSVGGATMPLVDPATGERYGTAPVSNERDVDNAYAAAGRAFCDWKRTTPSQRQKALLGFADELEKAADALVEAEGRNTGKPRHLTMAVEIAQMLDQTRFFAGAARVLEGKSAGEVPGRPYVVDPPRAGWGDRAGDAVELPDDDGDLEVRARDRGGQHRGDQAQ